VVVMMMMMMMMMVIVTGSLHDDLHPGGPEGSPRLPPGLDPPPLETEGAKPLLDGSEGGSRVDEGSQGHVPARPGEGLEVSDTHRECRIRDPRGREKPGWPVAQTVSRTRLARRERSTRGRLAALTPDGPVRILETSRIPVKHPAKRESSEAFSPVSFRVSHRFERVITERRARRGRVCLRTRPPSKRASSEKGF